jgi:hypothetical protein
MFSPPRYKDSFETRTTTFKKSIYVLYLCTRDLDMSVMKRKAIKKDLVTFKEHLNGVNILPYSPLYWYFSDQVASVSIYRFLNIDVEILWLIESILF